MKEKRNKKKRPKRLSRKRQRAQDLRQMYKRNKQAFRELRGRCRPTRHSYWEMIDPLCNEYPPIRIYEGPVELFSAYSERILSETASDLGIPAELLNQPFTNHPHPHQGIDQ